MYVTALYPGGHANVEQLLYTRELFISVPVPGGGHLEGVFLLTGDLLAVVFLAVVFLAEVFLAEVFFDLKFSIDLE